MSDVITQFQLDQTGRLEADPYFDDLPILQEQIGVTESDVATALGAITEKAGKLGAVVLVKMPTREVKEPEIAGPYYDIVGHIRVIENPLLNRAEGGTGKTAAAISLAVESLFHRWSVGAATVYVKGAAPWNDGEGNVGWDVTLGWFVGQVEAARCGPLSLVEYAGRLLLSCPTPGATIRYTKDGSYPGHYAPAWADPGIPLFTGTLRALAYADGLQAGPLLQATITTS